MVNRQLLKTGERKKLINIAITTGSYSGFIDDLIMLGKSKVSSYVCVANVHMCIEAVDDPQFANVVNNADLVTPDGIPIAKSMKLLYGIHQDRVAGMDLLPDLLRQCEQRELKVFFYGGTDALKSATEKYIANHYPELNVAGFHTPPFRTLTSEEERTVVQHINDSEANFIFVVLGCPKQEKWMANMKGRISACMVGIGGALPVMVGQQKRAPKWMQTNGLEWLFRLIQEPKRLLKRYAYTNTKFIYLLAREKLKRDKTSVG
jgi:bacterial polymer biosynthesis proteins, WecB/TagA/CpsF family